MAFKIDYVFWATVSVLNLFWATVSVLNLFRATVSVLNLFWATVSVFNLFWAKVSVLNTSWWLALKNHESVLMLYIPVNNFPVMSWHFPEFLLEKESLAQGHKTVSLVSIELGTFQSQVYNTLPLQEPQTALLALSLLKSYLLINFNPDQDPNCYFGFSGL